MGIRPGDAVLVIEHRGEQQLGHNALVAATSMDDKLAGTHGEPAIKVAFLARSQYALESGLATLTVPNVVHVSHRDFVEGRAALGYEELPELRALMGAAHALRSYQFGNAATDLAAEAADACEKALSAWKRRSRGNEPTSACSAF
jgi:hypothetical protein